jgi:hypothetical protein
LGTWRGGKNEEKAKKLNVHKKIIELKDKHYIEEAD